MNESFAVIQNNKVVNLIVNTDEVGAEAFLDTHEVTSSRLVKVRLKQTYPAMFQCCAVGHDPKALSAVSRWKLWWQGISYE